VITQNGDLARLDGLAFLLRLRWRIDKQGDGSIISLPGELSGLARLGRVGHLLLFCFPLIGLLKYLLWDLFVLQVESVLCLYAEGHGEGGQLPSLP